MFQSHREWAPVICFMHVFRHYIHVLTRGKNKTALSLSYLTESRLARLVRNKRVGFPVVQ